MDKTRMESLKQDLEQRIEQIRTQIEEASDSASQEWLDRVNIQLKELQSEYENLRADMSDDKVNELTHRVNATINQWNAEVQKLVKGIES
jgi:uncharacterized membrane-anchored protein YjiN (DUF445 family)